MSYEKIEGIVLHSLSYQERGRILKVFSKEKGISSLIIKGLSQKKPSLLTLSTPLAHGTFWINKSQSSDLYFVKEASLIEDHFAIRQKADNLSAAIEMLRIILSSQMHHKPSKKLFALFSSYLKNIQSFKDPSVLSTSFILKILMHDGLLHLKEHCSLCNKKPYEAISMGECYCKDHSPHPRDYLTEEEKDYLLVLGFCRSYKQLNSISLEPALKETVKNIFKGCHN